MSQQNQSEFGLQGLLVLVDLFHLYTDGNVEDKHSPSLPADELDEEEPSDGGDIANSNGSNREDDEGLDDEASLASNRCGPLLTNDMEKLKSRFLDRFAEFASKEKGPFSVTSSAMEEHENDVTLWLSVNENFSKKTKKRLRAFGKHLQGVGDTSNEGAEEALWFAMLDFNVSRTTRTYIPCFCKRLDEYKSRIGQRAAPSIVQGELSSGQGLSELQRLSTRPRPGNCQLGRWTESIIITAYSLRQDEVLKQALLREHENTAPGRRVWTSILFLGRLRAAFHTFVRAVRLLPCFDKVSIMFVPKADMALETLQRTPLTLDQAMASLTVEAKSSLRSRLRKKKKMSDAKAAARFLELQRLRRHVHSEMQMIWHLEMGACNELSIAYLGCSKYNCFLCWTFIQAYVPSTGCLDGRQKGQCSVAVEALIDRIMKRLAVKRLAPVQPAPESSAALTRSIDKVSFRESETSILAENFKAEREGRVPDKGLFDDFIAASNKDDQQPAELDRSNLYAPKQQRCTMCNKPKSRRCVECRSSAYCSTRCQETDWPLHKLLCRHLQQMLQTRPSDTFKLAIQFPVEAKVPKLVWIKCEDQRDEHDNYPYQCAIVDPLLGTDQPSTDRRYIGRSARRNFTLGHTVTVIFRDAFLLDGSKDNRSIRCAGGAVPAEWKGPVVVMSQPGVLPQFLSSSDLRFYEDVTLVDFRIAIDYFRAYSDETVEDLETYQGSLDDVVRGVKITCLGDQKHFGMEQYVAVAVPKYHLVSTVASRPTVPKLVGFPITVRKYPADQAWKDELGGDAYTNEMATILHRDANPASDWWGLVPVIPWDDRVGSVIVVSSGKEHDVGPREVEALCHFCVEMRPFFEDSTGAGLVQRTKEEVLGLLTPKHFRAFFDKFRAERAKDDASWTEVECPVDG